MEWKGLLTSRMRVLMYHKFSTDRSDFLTVTTHQFRDHLAVLKHKGYQYISLSQWLRHIFEGVPLPKRPILLTFDDAYLSQLTCAYPLLREFGAKATVFVPTAYLGGESAWNKGAEPLLSPSQLPGLDREVFELALHTHGHLNYSTCGAEELEEDLNACIQFFENNQLPYVRALAYPYGKRPQDPDLYRRMTEIFERYAIRMAFRIGNRINAQVPANLMEVNRIDVRGTDSLYAFKRKITFGRLL
jgi:peptidoglycan/xylan/chitin deacetylase (PgdA/CDA1 family)